MEIDIKDVRQTVVDVVKSNPRQYEPYDRSVREHSLVDKVISYFDGGVEAEQVVAAIEHVWKAGKITVEKSSGIDSVLADRRCY